MEDFTWWQDALIAIAGAGGTFILGLITKGITHGVEWLARKAKLAFLEELDDMAIAFVVDLYNSEVEAAKEAAKDGKLSPEEKARFKQIVIDKLTAHFGLRKLWSMFRGNNLDSALSAVVEKAVTKSKLVVAAPEASAAVKKSTAKRR